jgi:hypothetical protein
MSVRAIAQIERDPARTHLRRCIDFFSADDDFRRPQHTIKKRPWVTGVNRLRFSADALSCLSAASAIVFAFCRQAACMGSFYVDIFHAFQQHSLIAIYLYRFPPLCFKPFRDCSILKTQICPMHGV